MASPFRDTVKSQPAVFFGHYCLAAEAARDPLAKRCCQTPATGGSPRRRPPRSSASSSLHLRWVAPWVGPKPPQMPHRVTQDGSTALRYLRGLWEQEIGREDVENPTQAPLAHFVSVFSLILGLVFVSSHLIHGMLIGFHEASHGLLRKSRLLNEIDGIIIGVFGFMSFSLFRAVHQSHHAHFCTECDEELWPFVQPAISRPARILSAVLELSVGLLYTPFLFIHAFLRTGSRIRKKACGGASGLSSPCAQLYGLAFLTAIERWDLWRYFLWLY